MCAVRPDRAASSLSRELIMTIEHIETAIIGAGQAGLATAYYLQRSGRTCVILDGNRRVGDNWRAQWDSLRLYSPAGYDGLPGLPFPAPKWSYPTKDQVADYLAAYAERFALPVRMSTHVNRLEAINGNYVLHLADDKIIAENVVVATGTFGRTPGFPISLLILTPPFDSCIPANTADRHSSNLVRCSWWAAHTRAQILHSRWQRLTRPSWPVAIRGRCRCGLIIGALGCSGRPSCSW